MVTFPTWEAGVQRLTAKSAERHLGIAPGLPKTPVGRFMATSLTTSGWPGSSSTIFVVRSGWAPASVSEVPTSKLEIVGLAAAGAANTAATAKAARRLPIACLLILIFSLLIFRSAIPVARLALVVFPPLLFLLHALALALDEALLAGAVARGRLGADAGAGEGVDFRRARSLGAGAVALVGGRARMRGRVVEEPAVPAGVVDLHRAAVPVFVDEDLTGEEERVLAVAGDREHPRVLEARPGRDQLDDAFLVLVGVLDFVGVPERGSPARRAGGADDFVVALRVAVDLGVAERVERGQRDVRVEDGEVPVRRDLEVPVAMRLAVGDSVPDGRVVGFEGGDELRRLALRGDEEVRLVLRPVAVELLGAEEVDAAILGRGS